MDKENKRFAKFAWQLLTKLFLEVIINIFASCIAEIIFKFFSNLI